MVRSWKLGVGLVAGAWLVQGALCASAVGAQIAPERPTSHRIELELGVGIAAVRETLEFSRVPVMVAPAQLTMPLPAGAVLRSLRVCAGTRCRSGFPASDALEEVWSYALHEPAWPSAAPLAFGFRRSGALHIQFTQSWGVAPVRVIVEWSAPTQRVGAVEYFALPARDAFPVAPIVEASAPTLHDLQVHDVGAVHDQSVVVLASRVRMSALPAVRPVRAAVFIDASPSARADAEHIWELARSAIGALPAGSRVTTIAFASRARRLHEERDSATLLDGISPESMDGLGVMARPSTAWAIASRPEAPGVVIWVGDGELSQDAEAAALLREIAAAGTVLHVLSASDHIAPTLQLAVTQGGGVAYPLAHERGALLTRALGGLAAPAPTFAPATWTPTLQAARADLHSGGFDALVAVDPADIHNVRKVIDGRRARYRAGGGLVHQARRFLSCGGYRGCSVSMRGSISRQVLRRAIRRSVAPRVRACFRTARAGRPGWSARVTGHVVIREGEIVLADARGGDASLDACVTRAFDDVIFPALPDWVELFYPFVSAAVSIPPAVELGEAASEVDAVLAGFGRESESE